LPSDRVNVCPAETSAKEEDHLPKFASRMKAGFPRDPRPASRVPRLSVADREPTCAKRNLRSARTSCSANLSPREEPYRLRRRDSSRSTLPMPPRYREAEFPREREHRSQVADLSPPPHSSSSPNSMGIRSIRLSPFRFDGSSIRGIERDKGDPKEAWRGERQGDGRFR